MASALPPYLTDAEIAEICRPRRQGAAQIRYLESLGVKVERRPDGTPLVWRRDVERPVESAPAAGIVPAANQPKWSRHA